MNTTPKTILMIVESPQKAKKIETFLAGKPDTYLVAATKGHVADLPKKGTGDIDRVGGYEPTYVLTDDGAQVVEELRGLLAGVDEVILATDADREGELIASHVVEYVLRQERPDLVGSAQRVSFGSITEEEVVRALSSPRSVDGNLVEAAIARRVIDRLFGYDLTSTARRAVHGAARGGRTQSPALRMVVERERERMAFVPGEYWTVDAALAGCDGAVARISRHKGHDLVVSARHMEGSSPVPGRVALTGTEASAIAASVTSLLVTSREERPYARSPKPPYTASTFLQDANSKLGMSTAQANAIGEQLRMAGHITYLRTDNVVLSPDSAAKIRSYVAGAFGEHCLAEGAARPSRSGKVVQGAHDPIIPVHPEVAVPRDVDGRALELYTMVRERALASQMIPARGRTTTLRLEGGDAEFRVSATEIDEEGFLRALSHGDDDEASVDLSRLSVGDAVGAECSVVRHDTKPPARYTEASLIAALDEAGIGRPSTYQSMVSGLLQVYAWQDGGSRGPLIPRLSSFAMAQMLEGVVPEFVDYGYTRRLEESLDAIARGEMSRAAVVADFMKGAPGGRGFEKALEDAARRDPDPMKRYSVIARLGVHPDTGETVLLHGGRAFNGSPRPYVSCGGVMRSVPDEMELAAVTLDFAIARLNVTPRELGTEAESGMTVWLRNGAHGPYVQLGGDPVAEVGRKRKASTTAAPKPLTASLPDDADASAIGLDDALRLIGAAHRKLGAHPDTGELVWVSTSNRFGKTSSFVRCGAETRTVKGDPDAVDLEAALALLAVPKPERRGRRPRKR